MREVVGSILALEIKEGKYYFYKNQGKEDKLKERSAMNKETVKKA